MSRTKTKKSQCASCVHFVTSAKTGPEKGLCALYTLVMQAEDGCRNGWQPKGKARVRT